VTKIGWSRRGGGHTVLIDHGDIVTVYYHGRDRTALKRKQRVETGEFVYTSGTTGASTGNHLHFEVRKRGGRWGNTLDPVPFLTGAPATTRNVLPITGRFNRATWTAWQTALHDGGWKPGRIDGKPGRMTHAAIQRWADVKDDGILGPGTRRAVQEKLGVTADGVWGRITVSALQRRLNSGSI